MAILSCHVSIKLPPQKSVTVRLAQVDQGEGELPGLPRDRVRQGGGIQPRHSGFRAYRRDPGPVLAVSPRADGRPEAVGGQRDRQGPSAGSRSDRGRPRGRAADRCRERAIYSVINLLRSSRFQDPLLEVHFHESAGRHPTAVCGDPRPGDGPCSRPGTRGQRSDTARGPARRNQRIPQARVHRPQMGGERRRRDGAGASPVGLRQGRRDEGLLGGRAPAHQGKHRGSAQGAAGRCRQGRHRARHAFRPRPGAESETPRSRRQ